LSIKEEFLSLLERDKEFRYAVAGLLGLGEILRRLDEYGEKMVRIEEELARLREEQIKLREEQIKLREDMLNCFKRHDEEIAKLRDEQAKLREEQIRLREDMNRGFMLMERHISALGARWGLLSEEAFREGIRGVVERELGLRVERWVRFDGEGFVYGYPSNVEVDVAIYNGRLILVEVKSHVRASDIYIFKRLAEFYEKVEGRKPNRLVIVTPYADEKALEASLRLGVEVYTKV
jgi:hypothetical protein